MAVFFMWTYHATRSRASKALLQPQGLRKTAARSTGAEGQENQVTALMTPKEAAAMLRVSISTLRGWRKAGKGPPVARLGPGSYRYSMDSIEKYIKSRTSEPELPNTDRSHGRR